MDALDGVREGVGENAHIGDGLPVVIPCVGNT